MLDFPILLISSDYPSLRSHNQVTHSQFTPRFARRSLFVFHLLMLASLETNLRLVRGFAPKPHYRAKLRLARQGYALCGLCPKPTRATPWTQVEWELRSYSS